MSLVPRPPQPPSPMDDETEIYQFGYPSVDDHESTTHDTTYSTSNNDPFLVTYDDMAQLETDRRVLYHKNKYNYDMGIVGKTEWKSIDPRLLTLLQFFRQLYIRRKEVVKKIFPGAPDDLVAMFKKISGGLMLFPGKSDSYYYKGKTLQRSLSVGSPRTASAEDLRLERFKVRTVVPTTGGAAPDQGNDKGATKQSTTT